MTRRPSWPWRRPARHRTGPPATPTTSPCRRAGTDPPPGVAAAAALPALRKLPAAPPIAAYAGTGWRLWRRGAETLRAAATVADLARGGPCYLFAMQMENDYSIRAYSHFPDNDAALIEAIGSFARGAPAGSQLLVKVHPLDPGLKRWGRRLAAIAAAAGVAGRVHLLDGALAADAVILACRGVVTVNSTVGVSSIGLGRPSGPGAGDLRRAGAGLAGRDGCLLARRAATRPIAGGCLSPRHCRLPACPRPFLWAAGLDAAVAGALRRLHCGLINHPCRRSACEPGGLGRAPRRRRLR